MKIYGLIELRRWFWVRYLRAIWFFKDPLHVWCSIKKAEAEDLYASIVKEGRPSNEVLGELDARIEKVSAAGRPVSIAHFIVFLVLVLYSIGVDLNFDIQGLHIVVTQQIRELLFIALAILQLADVQMNAPKEILEATVQRLIKSSGSSRYAMYRYLHPVSMAFAMIKDARNFDSWTYLYYLLFIFVFGLANALLIVAAVLYGYVYVALDIYRHPAFSPTISHSILYWCMAVLLFSITLSVFPQVPLRRISAKYALQHEPTPSEADRREHNRKFGGRGARALFLFLRTALNRRNLLDGLSRREKLAAMGNEFSQKALKEEAKRQKQGPAQQTQ